MAGHLLFTVVALTWTPGAAFNLYAAPQSSLYHRGTVGIGAMRTAPNTVSIKAQASADSASATPAPQQSSILRLEDMPGIGPETGNKPWDPLGFANIAADEASGFGGMNNGGEPRATAINLAWYRAAELRHGRTAMLATLGWIATKAGLLFTGLDFVNEVKAVDVWGADQFWNSVPLEYKVAFFLPIFIVEWACETKEPHYTKTNTPGQFPDFVPENIFWPKEPQKFKDMQTKELKNGRLAMIAIVSFLSAEAIPGSVPLYPW